MIFIIIIVTLPLQHRGSAPVWGEVFRSFKQHLRRVVGEVRLTYEELATVLAQVETCLKSMPLTHLSRTVRWNRSINARAFPHWV